MSCNTTMDDYVDLGKFLKKEPGTDIVLGEFRLFKK